MKNKQASPAFTFSAFVKIIRPENLLMVAFAQLMTAFFLVGTTRSGEFILLDYHLYLLITSTVILTGSGYMINDYYDVKIDYVNRPKAVVIGKGMKRRMVMILHTVMNLVGISLGMLVHPKIGAITFLAAFLLWLYSNSLKRLPFIGNLTVASLTGLAIWIVGLYYQKSELLVLTYALFAFFINLIREILKDIEDRNGDRKHGCRTLPIVLGFRKTKQIIFFIAVLFVGAILFVTFKINEPLLFVYFSLLSVFFCLFMVKIYKADRKSHFTELSTLSKILMLTGILSMGFL
ncbi:geranylgeranylglycerol-phosphate geranylgeranyltransferase [Cyclobacterium jeungdonense]|uniref:Geranylgeranylglycerol-phosphate geranylgeranyltransferase n=1 Tax=Cyclobacterium jeungdonense TaxID=708087 RepID=A0ABT8C2S6_9BACT|nr:geranylgeranylglycerol-phosphate geranylgeranyltransferase [Cyclobacterium jeungdonense]MDN3687079.1 geranylgeranylglycerol-phosphate geranylgeranyltransferase [Cyclobacterium jeungdonense]